MIYREISFIISFVINYILIVMVVSDINKSRQMKNGFLAYIPIINNSLSLGLIFDDISKDYKQKTKRGIILLILQILVLLALAISIFTFIKVVPDLAAALTNNSLNLDNYTNSINSLSNIKLEIFVFVNLIVIIVTALYLVFYFKTLNGIYKEYAGARAYLYIVITIFVSIFLGIQFVGSLFLFLIRKNTPQYLILNSKTTYNN